ncbi:hypothetical protein ACFL2O_05350 [Thermodesulfobacteriota bacterium]
MAEKFVKGDRKAKIVLFSYIGFWVVLGIIFLPIIEMKLSLSRSFEDARKLFFVWLFIPFSIYCAVKAVYFLRYGLAILKEKRYPPSKMKNPFKMKLVEGKKSIIYSCLSFSISLISVLFIVFAAYIGYGIGTL